ncbi:NAD-dependent epimerase/dehydratase family protein [Kribbella sp. CA-293567]|uniref:NAD-dependent epimerase/dehydratase family protein n=1 Tax=Kribbella sp. CA-293567 TaxID=3002436 RepID=UPI0022DD9595|nr:NAD-dependent epimerase/dehydratase family protein [Kribbella sp. CA-293567]WBQ07989.1 NAD-dependent epimerase/dehydratase family protein [Kribbella sp. CA-293567]
MKVLLTGGAGFIGRHVQAQLLADGHEVRVLDSLRPDVHHVRPSVEGLVVGDIRDAEAVDQALHGVDTVVHLAAKVGLGVDLDDMDDYVSTNSLGTAVLLRALGRHRIERFVYASSMVVYGEGHYECDRHGVVAPGPRRVEDLEAGQFDPRCPICAAPLRAGLVTEAARTDPRNTYAATKLHGEHLAATWARETGGQATGLRFHNVYGPGMPRNTPYAGVAAIFRSMLEQGETPKVFEDGAQRRDFIHVADIATAVAAAMVADGKDFTAYNVGSGTVRTIGDLATELARAYGGPEPIVTGAYRLGDVRHITASSERLRDELGWKPDYDLRSGLEDLLKQP